MRMGGPISSGANRVELGSVLSGAKIWLAPQFMPASSFGSAGAVIITHIIDIATGVSSASAADPATRINAWLEARSRRKRSVSSQAMPGKAKR